jgi:hypothetical protein
LTDQQALPRKVIPMTPSPTSNAVPPVPRDLAPPAPPDMASLTGLALVNLGIVWGAALPMLALGAVSAFWTDPAWRRAGRRPPQG